MQVLLLLLRPNEVHRVLVLERNAGAPQPLLLLLGRLRHLGQHLRHLPLQCDFLLLRRHQPRRALLVRRHARTPDPLLLHLCRCHRLLVSLKHRSHLRLKLVRLCLRLHQLHAVLVRQLDRFPPSAVLLVLIFLCEFLELGFRLGLGFLGHARRRDDHFPLIHRFDLLCKHAFVHEALYSGVNTVSLGRS